jgi:hypothetical protein
MALNYTFKTKAKIFQNLSADKSGFSNLEVRRKKTNQTLIDKF